MHDNTQSWEFERILYKLFTMHHNCCNLVECHIILLTWYCTKLQLNDLQYLSTMHHMDICFAYECWLTNCITPESMPSPPPPTLFCTLLWGKSGEGAFARIFNSSRAYTPSSILHNLEYAQGRQSQRLLWLSGKTSASLNVHCGQSVVLVLLTKTRGIEATCIVSGDRGRRCVSLHFQCGQLKYAGYSDFVCTRFLVQSMMGS